MDAATICRHARKGKDSSKQAAHAMRGENMDTNSQILIQLYDYEKERIHNSWKNFIIESNPKIFLSFSFLLPDKSTKPFITRNQAITTINELFKRINRALFGRKLSNHLRGFGCLEYQKSGQPHFHFLLGNDDISIDRLKQIIHKKIKNAFHLLDANRIDIQPVHDAEGVAEYMTKLYEKWDSLEKMILLTKEGIME